MDVRVRGECGGPDVPAGNAVDELDERAGGESEEVGSAGLGVGYFSVLHEIYISFLLVRGKGWVCWFSYLGEICLCFNRSSPKHCWCRNNILKYELHRLSCIRIQHQHWDVVKYCICQDFRR